MHKSLWFPIAIGNMLICWPIAAWSGTLTFTDGVSLSQVPWTDTMSIPQYNPANFQGAALTDITITAEGGFSGNYTLTNPPPPLSTRTLTYGTRSDDVGADISVIELSSFSAFLNPLPFAGIGSGIVFPGESKTFPLEGQALFSVEVERADFGSYTGTGNVTFLAEALNFFNVSITGGRFSQEADLSAYVNLVVTYTYDDSQSGSTEISEPNLGILSLLVFGLAGFFLTSRKA